MTFSASGFEGGSGAESDPYEINTCQQLQDMDGDVGAHYELIGNIDCSGYDFEMIGGSSNGFSGSLDGNGYQVEELELNSVSHAAFFHNIGQDGVVSNVIFRRLSVQAGSGSSGSSSNCNGESGEDGGNATGISLINEGSISRVKILSSEIYAGNGGNGENGGTYCTGYKDQYGGDGGSGGEGGSATGAVIVNNGDLQEISVNATIDAGSGGNGGSGGDGDPCCDNIAGGEGGNGGNGGDGGYVSGLSLTGDGTVTKSKSNSFLSGGNGGNGGNGGEPPGLFGGGAADGGDGAGGNAYGLVKLQNSVSNSYSNTRMEPGNGASGGEDGKGYGIASDGTSTIIDSYWNNDIAPGATSNGGIGLSTDEMIARDTFIPEWDFEDTWGFEQCSSSLPELGWNKNTLSSCYPQIDSCSDLSDVRNGLNRPYELSQDIDCSGYSFEQIGSDSSSFGGIIDGKGHKIENLEVYSGNTDSELAFIHEINRTGLLKNIVFEDLRVEADNGQGGGNGNSCGEEGENGEDGQEAAGLTVVNNGTIERLQIIGGSIEGGNGGNGGEGYNGKYDAGCGSASGGNGGDGGDAAGMAFVNNGIIKNSAFKGNVFAGLGGNGGDGGPVYWYGAGSGGHGGDGGSSVGTVFSNSGEIRNINGRGEITGGDGGNGGNGGDSFYRGDGAAGGGGNGGEGIGMTQENSGLIIDSYVSADLNRGLGGSRGGGSDYGGSDGSNGQRFGFTEQDTGSVENSFWNFNITNASSSASGINSTTLELKSPSTFDGLWDLENTWGFKQCYSSYPELRWYADNLKKCTYPFLLDLKPANETLTTTTPVTLSAEYRNPSGSADGTVKFWQEDGTKIGQCTTPRNTRCSVEWSSPPSNKNYWFATATTENGDESPKSDLMNFIYNLPPEKIEEPVEPISGSGVVGNEITLEVDPKDPDGDSMNVEFSTNVSNSSFSTRTVNGVSNDETGETELDVERGRTYKWWVNVSDQWSSTKSEYWTFYANGLPRIEEIFPRDEGLYTGDEVNLSVKADYEKADDNRIYAYFYKQSGEFMGKDSGKSGDLLKSKNWTDLRLGQLYKWEVKLSDGYENETHGLFEFTRSATRIFRVDQRIETTYSSLISSTGSSSSFILKVENRVSTPKQMRTQLRNVNAYFDQTGQDEIEYSLDSFETKEFLVIVQPENTGRRNLEIISENRNIDLNTTDKVPVLVREVESVSDARNVPGMGSLNLVVILLISTLIFKWR